MIAENTPSTSFNAVPPVQALDWLARANETLAVVALLVDLVVTFANTAARYAFNSGLDWASDVSTICMAAMTFLGAPAFYRRGTGMAYTAVVDGTSGHVQQTLRGVALWTVLAISALGLAAYPTFLRGQGSQTLAVLGTSNLAVAIWLGIGLALAVVYTLEKMRRVSIAGLVAGFGIVALVAAGVFALRIAEIDGSIDIDPFLVIVPLVALGFVAGTPIAFLLLFGGALHFVITGDAPLVTVPAALQAGIGGFILLAIPLFMLAGALMDVTGMAGRLVGLIERWVGHWRGGLLQAQMVAMYVFSGISGSKVADMATVGGIMKDPLRARGYPPTESVAVLGAAAAMGEVIPPSIALLVLGSVTTLSVGSLFVAGIIPAALLAVALAVGIVIRSRMLGLPTGAPFRIVPALAAIPAAIPALLVPVIVVGGIVAGIASPTESSSFAVIYGLLAALLFYRSVRVGTLWRCARDSAVTAGMVLFMVASANLLIQAVVMDGLGRQLAADFFSLQSRSAFLFISITALVVLGFVLEGLPAILIAAPIFLPVAQGMGVDPLHYGVLLVMAIGIGVFMPPVGIGYYMACSLGDAPPGAAMLPSLFYTLFLLAGLSLLILIPELTLGLPHAFGMR